MKPIDYQHSGKQTQIDAPELKYRGIVFSTTSIKLLCIEVQLKIYQIVIKTLPRLDEKIR